MEHVKVFLLDKDGNVQYGLNWGQRENRDPNQAYLQLTPDIYNGDFFPPKGKYFIVRTDDGKTLIFNRAQKDKGCALQTPESNAVLGLYIRERLGLKSGEEITNKEIENAPYPYFVFYKQDDMNYWLTYGGPVKDPRELYEKAELSKQVREGFIRYWEIIDQHGADKELYTSYFEKTINEQLEKLSLSYNDVFEIINYKEYEKIIETIAESDPSLAYLTGEGPNGDRYYVWSTSRHYRNYLEVLAASSFLARTDKDELGPEDSAKQPDKKPLQLIYYGAPGTGKSYEIDALADEDNSVRTTFHPDTDYASFVGAYKPTMEPSKISTIIGKTVGFAIPEPGHSGMEKKIAYKFVPQAFLKAYVAAWKNYATNTPFYLIIEEINRGNCAQIFGDLFQLLDRNNMGCSAYAIDADDDIRQYLFEVFKVDRDPDGSPVFSQDEIDAIRQFVLVKDNGKRQAIGEQILSGAKLLLPPNLRIWATMNTSDQSLFPIDSAFKRRWNWKYMPIAYDKENWRVQVGNAQYMWGDFLRTINPIIYALTESSDKQMGYYFAKADPKTGVISEEVFLNKVLFYLWTDVLKDYSMEDNSAFINPATDKPYAFTDFFDADGNPGPAVSAFVAQGLKLTPVAEVEPEPETAEDDTAGANGEVKFMVDGNKSRTITWAMYLMLRDAAKTRDFADIENVVNDTIVREKPVIKRLDSAATYQKENGWLNKVIRTKDGVDFVVSNQWKQEMVPMVADLANKLGVNFQTL